MEHIISEEQANILSQIENNTDPQRVKYLDAKVAVDTLILYVIDNLEKGKSISITCPDSNVLRILETALENADLTDFTLCADSIASIPDKSIARLRSNVKSKIIRTHTAAKDQLEMSIINDNIYAAYANLFDVSHGSLKVADLPYFLTTKPMSKALGSIDMDGMLPFVDHKNFHLVSGKIHELSQTYHPIFRALENSEVINKTVLSSDMAPTKYNLLIEEVTKLLQATQDIQDSYSTLLATYKSDHRLHWTQSVEKAKIALKHLSLNIEITESKPTAKVGVMGLFKKDKNTAATELKTLIKSANSITSNLPTNLNIETIDSETPDREVLVGYINNVVDKLNQARFDDQYFGDNIKHLSLLNHKDTTWSNLSKSLTELLDNLNSKDILTEKYENNSNALLHQISLMKTVKDSLSYGKYRLEEHKNYYSYQSKIAQDEYMYLIVDELKSKAQSQWREIFDISYYNHQVQKWLSTALPGNNNGLAEASNQAKNLYTSRIRQVISMTQENQKLAIEKLIKSNKPLYQSLLKKRLPIQSTQSELATSDLEVAQKLFPIHIYNKHTEEAYDICLSIGASMTPDQKPDVSFSVFEEADFSDMSESKDYLPLYLNHYQYTKAIDSLSNTDKIKAAKKLAKLLLAINQDVKIYQLKTANIISLLPFQDDQVLETSLLEKGAKTMHLDDVYLQLVESILETGRSQYLLIKDGLIESSKYEHFLWQYEVICKYQSAGIKVKSLYTEQQLLCGLSAPIHQLVDEILVSDADNNSDMDSNPKELPLETTATS